MSTTNNTDTRHVPTNKSLDRLENVAMRVHSMLHGLGIDIERPEYVPMFTTLLSAAVDKVDDFSWSA